MTKTVDVRLYVTLLILAMTQKALIERLVEYVATSDLSKEPVPSDILDGMASANHLFTKAQDYVGDSIAARLGAGQDIPNAA